MKKYISIFILLFVLFGQRVSAQQTESADNYCYYKAIELIDNDGDLKEARRLINENIKQNPKHILSYVAMVQLDMNDRDYASALRNIEKALKTNYKKSGVSDAKLLWWKATIYDDMGDKEKAIPILESAVKLATKNKDEDLMSMMDRLADLYHDVKDYNTSDAIYRQMIKIDEFVMDPKFGLVKNMIARGAYDKAGAMLDECRKFNKEDPYIYWLEVKLYDATGEYKKMIDAMVSLYEKTEEEDYLDLNKFNKDKKYSMAVIKGKIARGGDNIIWKFCLLQMYKSEREYIKELELLNGIIADYSEYITLYEMRATCYSEMGMTDLALVDMTKCIELSDEENLAYYHALRGDVYKNAGKYAEAIADFDKFIEFMPTYAYGYYAKGWCKELSGDDKGAMECYEEGIAINDQYPHIYLMRGEMNLKWGNIEAARGDFERILELDTVAVSGSCRHYALHFLGKDDQALKWMEKMIAEDETDYGLWYDKACLLGRMGRCDQAMEALGKTLEKGYRKFAHLENDDDMDPIREREDYKELVARYRVIFQEELLRIGAKAQESGPKGVISEIKMTRMYGGTYEIPCQVNGLPLKMIFDTGAASVTISSVEANFMLKNGYLKDSDVKGKSNYITASGDIHEGTVLRLKEVKLGDAVLKDVEASVVSNQKAPLLLGQSVLEKFGTITIDNINSKLKIKQ